MGLNVKAAVVICLASIGGMSWAVQQFSMPRVEMASPLVADAAPGRSMYQPLVGAVTLTADGGGRRGEWVQQFARLNALDVQAEMNRATRDSLVFHPPADPLPYDERTTALPPLIYDPEVVVASAEPAGAEWPPEPENEVVLVAGEVADAQRPEPGPVAEPKRYRVAKGDTLTRVAQREWKSSDARLLDLLVAANPKLRERGSLIVLGEELLIPDVATAQRVLAGEKATLLRTVEDAAVAWAGAAPKTAAAQWYTIQKSDSLTSIARRFLKDGRRWREILALNRALDPHRIVPGTRIKLPPVIRLAQR